MEGVCLCGAITVKITKYMDLSKPDGLLCHCKNCRKTSGGVFSANIVVDDSEVLITGEDKFTMFKDPATTSGQPLDRYFCSVCGIPIKSTSPLFKGKTIIKLGVFNKIPPPASELFSDERQDWEKPIEGAAQYKGMGVEAV